MRKASRINPTDPIGFSRLAVEGTARLTDLTVEMQQSISSATGILGRITSLVYGSVRAVTGLVGGGMDALLTPLEEHPPPAAGCSGGHNSPGLRASGRPPRFGSGIRPSVSSSERCDSRGLLRNRSCHLVDPVYAEARIFHELLFLRRG